MLPPVHAGSSSSAAAALVSALLQLPRPEAEEALSCAQLRPSAAADQKIEQQQQHVQQILAAAHKQPSLLASVWPLLLARQQLWPVQQQQAAIGCHHYHQQQCRWLSSSAKGGGSSSSSSPASWPGAVPPLHQPNKLVSGTTPLRVPALEAPAPATAAVLQEAAAVSQPAPAVESVFVRNRAVILAALLCVTTGAALFIFVQAAILSTMPTALTSRNPVWQKNALRQLQWVLRMRQAFGEPVVQKLAEAGILMALVQVLQPGTDALVLIESCDTIRALLDSPSALEAFNQAGLPQTLDTALREGWVPKGALKTVALLHRRLS